MKTRTIYITIDGQEFEKEFVAKEHEDYINTSLAYLSMLTLRTESGDLIIPNIGELQKEHLTFDQYLRDKIFGRAAYMVLPKEENKEYLIKVMDFIERHDKYFSRVDMYNLQHGNSEPGDLCYFDFMNDRWINLDGLNRLRETLEDIRKDDEYDRKRLRNLL